MKKNKDINHIYDRISMINEKEFGLIERVCKLQEEVGELSAEALKQIGYKKSDLSQEEIRKNILLETVDCLIMTMDILSTQGFSKEEIVDIAESQISKWIKNKI